MKFHQSELLERARKRDLTHPTMKAGLDEGQWIDALARCGRTNPLDRSVAEAAFWVAHHLNMVRNTRDHFKLRNDEEISVKDVIHYHIAAANYAFAQIVEEQIQRRNENRDLLFDSEIKAVTNLTRYGYSASASEVVMTRLDSAKGAIHDAMVNKHNLEGCLKSGSDDASGMDKSSFVDKEVYCSELYHGGAAIWQDVLYGDTFFARHPHGSALVLSKLNDMGVMRAICDFRRDQHAATELLMVKDFADGRVLLFDKRMPKAVIKYEGGASLEFMMLSQANHDLRKVVAHRWAENLVCIEPHLFALLDIKCQNENYSIRDVLLVWFHLTIVAHQFMDRISNRVRSRSLTIRLQ